MFERVESLIGIDNLNKIKEKTVMVVGLGGVGGHCVESLIRSGIGNIIIVDFDKVELSNLNRQVISYYDAIGMKKTDVCKERIKSINPGCNVISLDMFLDSKNIDSILKDHNIDYIVDACDSIDTKKVLIEKSIENKIKLITCLGTGNKLDPSKLKITDIRNTFNDPLAKKLRKWVKDTNIKEKVMVVSSEELPIKKGRVISTMCFVPNIAGIMLANYVIKDIILKI